MASQSRCSGAADTTRYSARVSSRKSLLPVTALSRSFGQLMVVAQHARQAPLPVLFLPDLRELRRLGQPIGFALLNRVEAVRAGLDRAVVVERIDLHRLGHELARRQEVDALLLPLALVLRGLDEVRARSADAPALVVKHLEILGDAGQHALHVAGLHEKP